MQTSVDHKSVAENISVYLQNHTFIDIFSLPDVCKILDLTDLQINQAIGFLTECKAKFKSVEIFKIIQHLKVVTGNDFTKVAELLSIIFKSLKSPVLKSIYQSYHELLSVNHAKDVEIQRLKDQITILHTSISQNKTELTQQQGEHSGIMNAVNQKDEEINQLKELLNAKEKETDELRDKIDDLFPQVQKKTKDVATLKSMLKKRDATIKKQKEELNEYRVKLGLPVEEEPPAEEKEPEKDDEEKKKKIAALKAKKAKIAAAKQKQQENAQQQGNQESYVPKLDNTKKTDTKPIVLSSRRKDENQQEDTQNNNISPKKASLPPKNNDSALSAANTNENAEQKKEESAKKVNFNTHIQTAKDRPPAAEKVENQENEKINQTKTEKIVEKDEQKNENAIEKIQKSEEQSDKNNIQQKPAEKINQNQSETPIQSNDKLTSPQQVNNELQKSENQQPEAQITQEEVKQVEPKEEAEKTPKSENQYPEYKRLIDQSENDIPRMYEAQAYDPSKHIDPREDPSKNQWLMPPPLPEKNKPLLPPPVPANPIKIIDELEIEEMHEAYKPVQWTLSGNASAVQSQNPKNFINPNEMKVEAQPSKLNTQNSLPKLKQSTSSLQKQVQEKPQALSNLPKLAPKKENSLTSQLKAIGTPRYDISFLKPPSPPKEEKPQQPTNNNQSQQNQPQEQQKPSENIEKLKKLRPTMNDFDQIYHVLKKCQKENDNDAIKFAVEKKLTEVKDDVGNTSFLNAAYKGDLPLMRALAENGCNVLATNNNKWSAGYWAVMNNSLPIMKYLCGLSKYDINLKTNTGDTVLHAACNLGRMEIVQYLVKVNGIKLEEKNHDGKTPMAAIKDSKYIGFWDKKKYKEVLKDAGAKN